MTKVLLGAITAWWVIWLWLEWREWRRERAFDAHTTAALQVVEFHPTRCPDCPAELLVADGDRIEHVADATPDWPHGWHRYIPGKAPTPRGPEDDPRWGSV